MLRLANVRKSYVEPDGNRPADPRHRPFHVAAGEQVVLVGRSGCGKTTLLHVIAGITRPDAGHGPRSTATTSPDCPRPRATASAPSKIGYVFQTFNLLPGFSALENVMLGHDVSRAGKPMPAGPGRCSSASASAHRLTHKPAHALGGRTAARGRRPGAGQSAEAAAGRRTDGQRRRRQSAADHRPDPRVVPRREASPCCW